MTRTYRAPHDADRCKAERRPLRDKSGARCMKRATKDGYCHLHTPKTRTGEDRTP